MFLCASAPACLIACDTVKYGSWWLSKGTPAEVLYKGTITRIIGEDSPSRAEKVREDALPKGHVIYEGKKGHVLSYDGKSEPAASRAGAAVLGFWEIFEARLDHVRWDDLAGSLPAWVLSLPAAGFPFVPCHHLTSEAVLLAHRDVVRDARGTCHTVRGSPGSWAKVEPKDPTRWRQIR